MFEKVYLPKIILTITLLSVPFLVFYLLFFLTYQFIHRSAPAINPELIVFWHQEFLSIDGHELPLLFGGIIFYLLLSYSLIKSFKNLPLFTFPAFQIAVLMPVLFIFARLKSEMFTVIPNLITNLIFTITVLSILFVSYKIYQLVKSHKKLSKIVVGFLWSLLFVFILLSHRSPDYLHSNFLFGQALKISQGEAFGAFHLQYGILITFILNILMFFHQTLPQMQVVFSFLFVFWLFLYYLLASKIIKQGYLVFLFLITLVITRYLAIYYDPISIPQDLPLRLDLWLPLVLVVFRFGILSPITSTVVAITYLADSTFGLLYLGVYIVFTAFLTFKRISKNYQKVLLTICPVFLALLIQFILFKSFTLPSASIYTDFQLGFIPVSFNSLFWVILAFLPYYLFVAKGINDSRTKIFYLFLLAIAVVQLIYFLGRSHDQNLLNISGIFITMFFIVIYELSLRYKLQKGIFILVALFITLISLLFGGSILAKFNQALSNLSQNLGNSRYDLEFIVSQKLSTLGQYSDKEKVVILSRYDSYINYRYGFKQVGYWTPFYIHTLVDETTDFLINLIKKEYHVLFWEDELTELIEQLNKSPKMTTLGKQFSFVKKDQIYELTLVKSSSPLNGWDSFTTGKFFINYPKTWILTEEKEKVSVSAPFDQITIQFKINDIPSNYPRFPINNIYGTFIEEGWMQLSESDKLFVRRWENSDYLISEIYLLKDSKLVEIVARTTEPTQLRRIYQLIKSVSYED